METQITSKARVTVLLPVYNAERYLRESLDSIFAQTLSEFKILAIDDGSTDGSLEILKSYGDSRLRILRHDHNLGLIATLNEGLETASTEYVARMDADDICMPNRFRKQVEFMDANPEIGLCGAWAQCFGGYSGVLSHPSEPDTIRCTLLFDSAFVHPTVVFRLSAVREHRLRYGDYPHAEDLALWREAVDLFPTANVPEVLLNYRVHPESVTGALNNRDQIGDSLRSSDQHTLSLLGAVASDADLELHSRMRGGGDLPLDDVEGWLSKLQVANSASGYYPKEVFREVLAKRWFLACYGAMGWAGGKWNRLRKSSLYSTSAASTKDWIKFAVRVRK